MGMFSLARAAGLPVVSALFPIPKIALLPLLILWFGIGEPSKVATIALGTFFPTAIATFSGVDGVPRTLIRMAQSFGVPTARIVWSVVLPGARSEEHTSELQSLMRISYAVFCLKKKKKTTRT